MIDTLPKAPWEGSELDENGLPYAPWESRSTQQPQEQPKPEPSGMMRRYVADPLVSLGKGLVSLNDASIGLADLATGGYAGKKLEEATGYNSGKVQEFLDTKYSPERQQINQGMANEEGFLNKLAYATKNPSTIAHSVIQSAPAMVGAGYIGRALIGAAPTAMAAAGSGAGKLLGIGAEYATPLVAGSIGEGLIQTAGSAEGIRQDSPDKTLSAKGYAGSLASGVFDALITLGSGKVAQYLGVADKDVLLAGGKTAKPVMVSRETITKDGVKTITEKEKGLFRKTIEGAINEGVLQELPQGVQETILQNLASDKPWDEGVSESAAMGMLSGIAMGGGASVYDAAANRKTGTSINQEKSITVDPRTIAADELAPQADDIVVDNGNNIAPTLPPAVPPIVSSAPATDDVPFPPVPPVISDPNADVDAALTNMAIGKGHDISTDTLIASLTGDSLTLPGYDNSGIEPYVPVGSPSTAEESANVFSQNEPVKPSVESAATIADGIRTGDVSTPYDPAIDDGTGIVADVKPKELESLSLDSLSKARGIFESRNRPDVVKMIDDQIADKKNAVPKELRTVFGVMRGDISAGGIEGMKDVGDGGSDKLQVVGKISTHQPWFKKMNKSVEEHFKELGVKDRTTGSDEFETILKKVEAGYTGWNGRRELMTLNREFKAAKDSFKKGKITKEEFEAAKAKHAEETNRDFGLKNLTADQKVVWDEMLKAADEYSGQHPDAVAASDEDYFKIRGMSANHQQPINVESLQFGDKLMIKGEMFEVKGMDDEGNVVLQDGKPVVVPAFGNVEGVDAVEYADNPKEPVQFKNPNGEKLDTLEDAVQDNNDASVPVDVVPGSVPVAAKIQAITPIPNETLIGMSSSDIDAAISEHGKMRPPKSKALFGDVGPSQKQLNNHVQSMKDWKAELNRLNRFKEKAVAKTKESEVIDNGEKGKTETETLLGDGVIPVAPVDTKETKPVEKPVHLMTQDEYVTPKLEAFTDKLQGSKDYQRKETDRMRNKLIQEHYNAVDNARRSGDKVPVGNLPQHFRTKADNLKHQIEQMVAAGNPDANKPSMVDVINEEHRQEVEESLKYGGMTPEEYTSLHEKDYGAIEKFLPKNNSQPSEIPDTKPVDAKENKQSSASIQETPPNAQGEAQSTEGIQGQGIKTFDPMGMLTGEVKPEKNEEPYKPSNEYVGAKEETVLKLNEIRNSISKEISDRTSTDTTIPIGSKIGFKERQEVKRNRNNLKAEQASLSNVDDAIRRIDAGENIDKVLSDHRQTLDYYIDNFGDWNKEISNKLREEQGSEGTQGQGSNTDKTVPSTKTPTAEESVKALTDIVNKNKERSSVKSGVSGIYDFLAKPRDIGIPLKEVRQQFPDVSKADFDAEILRLNKDGKIQVTYSALPQASLTEQKKADRIEVKDRNGETKYIEDVYPVRADRDQAVFVSENKNQETDNAIIDSILSQPYAKNWKITQKDNGSFRVDVGGGKYFDLKLQDNIDLSKGSVEQAYGKSADEMRDEKGELLVVAGSFNGKERTIRVRRDTFGNIIFDHEFYHFLEFAGLIRKNEIDILKDKIKQMAKEGKWETLNKKDIGGSEDRAQFIAEALDGRRSVTGLWNKIVQRIKDFMDWVNDVTGSRSAESIVRDVESGKVLGREGNTEPVSAGYYQAAFAKKATSSNQKDIDSAYESVPEQTKKEHEKAFNDARNDSLVFIKSKDSSIFDKWLLSPMYKKSQQMQKAYESAVNWTEDKVKNFDRLIKDYRTGIRLNKSLEDLQKTSPKEYETIRDKWLLFMDKERVGYSVKEDDKSKGQFILTPPANMTSRRKEEAFKSYKEAWAAAREYELQDYLATAPGATQAGADAIRDFRKINDNILEMRMEALSRIMEECDAQGVPYPQIVTRDEVGGEIKTNLKAAVANMNEIRGYYFPRLRQQGRMQMKAVLENSKGEITDRVMKFYDVGFLNDKGGTLKNLANKAIGLAGKAGIETMESKRRELEAKGYKVSIKEAERLPESIFQDAAGKQLSLEKMMDKAIQNLDADVPKTLKDIGIHGKWDKAKNDYTVYDLTILKGVTADVLVELGGVYEYKAKKGIGGMGTYVFKDAPKDIEKLIKDRIFKLNNINPDIGLSLATSLLEGMADVIRSHGSRANMTKRSTDYWSGFETDPAIAVTRSAQSVAGGEAKRTLAINLLNVANGTIESMDEFKEKNPTLSKKALTAAYQAQRNELKIDPASQSELWSDFKSYMNDLLRNEETWDRMVGQLTGLAVAKYLMFRVAAPVANMTAMVTTAPASMNAHAGIEFKNIPGLIGRAGAAYTAYLARTNEHSSKLFKNPDDMSKINPRMVEIFDAIKDRGWDKAQYNYEAVAVLRSKVGRGWDRVIDWGMAMFGITEQINRATTIAAAYNGIMDKAGRSNDPLDQDVLKQAHAVSDFAHGVYGKADSMYVARGADPMSNIMRSNLTFKKFAINFMMNLYDIGVRQQNLRAAAYMVLSPMIVGGVGASIASGPAMFIANSILSAMGMGSDDPEEELYKFIETNFGGATERAARYGIPGLAGINIKGSVDVGMGSIPTSFVDIFGAPGAVVKDVYEGVQETAQGNVWKGLEGMAPNAIGSVSKAVRESTEGATKKSNAPIFYGNEQLKLSFHEAVARALSFSPAEMSEKKERMWSESNIKKKYSEDKDEILDKYRRFYLLPIDKRDKEKLYSLQTEVSEFNKRLLDRKINRAMVSPITYNSIKTSIRRAFKPNKFERYRASTMDKGDDTDTE
jgi:hypothetical protein